MLKFSGLSKELMSEPTTEFMIYGSQSCAEGYKSPFTSMTGWVSRECIFLSVILQTFRKKRKNMGGIHLKNGNFTGCSRDA